MELWSNALSVGLPLSSEIMDTLEAVSSVSSVLTPTR